jgi:cobalt/nickel transport system permease protein
VPVAFSDTSLATLIFFRSNLIIFLSLSLFYKQDLYKIVKALNILKINKKFIAIVFFAIKSIDMLIKDIKKIDKTLKARGFVAKSDIFTYKTYANMFAIILIKSINKSKQFNKALIARGYKDEIYLIDNSCFSFVDIVFVSVLISSFLNIGVIV